MRVPIRTRLNHIRWAVWAHAARPSSWLLACWLRARYLGVRARRQARITLPAAFAVAMLLAPPTRSLFLVWRDEGAIGAVAHAVARVVAALGTSHAWLLQSWLLPASPVWIPAYAAFYLALGAIARALYFGRRRVVRVAPLRVLNAGGQGDGTALSALLAQRLSSGLRRQPQLQTFARGRRRYSGVLSRGALESVLVRLEDPTESALEDAVRVAGVSNRSLEIIAHRLLGTETTISGTAVRLEEARYEISLSCDSGACGPVSLSLEDARHSADVLDGAVLAAVEEAVPSLYVELMIGREQASEALRAVLRRGSLWFGSASKWESAVERTSLVAAWAFLREDDPAGAEETLRQAIFLLPSSWRLTNGLGFAHLCAERYDEAETEAKRAIALAPAEAGPWLTLSQAQYLSGRWDEALVPGYVAYYLRGAEDGSLHLHLAKVCIGLHRKEAARRHSLMAIRAFPLEVLPRVFLSHALTSSREAAKVLKEAVRLAPDDPEGYMSLGFLLADHGELQAAADSFRQASVLAPDYSNAHFWRYVVLREAGQREAAEAELAEARRLGSEFANHPERHGLSKQEWT